MNSLLKKIYKTMLVVVIIALIGTAQAFSQTNNYNSNKTTKIVVEYRLVKDGLISKNNINVKVENNTITLSGTINSLSQKKKAEKDARDVNENYKIVNNLKIKKSKLTSTDVVKKVLHNIHDHVFYSVFDWVSAADTNGVVTLTGWAHEPWNKTIFQNEAEKVPGVQKVVNKIQTTFGPGSIGVRAARLIYSDPMFESYAYSSNPPIHIIVKNGKVILLGHVDSEAESSWAANLVRFHTDAFSVNNDLYINK